MPTRGSGTELSWFHSRGVIMATRRPGLGKLPPSVRRRLLLTLGAIEERLVEWHAQAAAAFVREVAPELPLEDAMSIFLRVVEVPDRHQESVSRRALALMEENHATPPLDIEYGRGDLIGRLLRRLGGRREDHLRARVAHLASRARQQARNLYLEGAHEVTAALADLLPPVEAVQVYVDALEIPRGWAEVIFHDAIAEMGEAAAD
jgi:hypothetical protein